MEKINLLPGDTVFYVLKNREIRPLIVTRIDANSKNINGVVHFDGPHDAKLLDAEVRNDDLLRTGTLWMDDIPYSKAPVTLGAREELVPGTWHLPPSMAAAAGGS